MLPKKETWGYLETPGPESKTSAQAKQSARKKKLVLIDFDGTITTKDTLLEFLLYYKGSVRTLSGMLFLSPILMLYAMRLLPNWKAKRIVLKWFFSGEKLSHFDSRCFDFSTLILPDLIRPKALHIIQQYMRDHATVVVVSASAENWVRPWCEQNGLLYLATQLEVKDGILSGDFCGKNCYGPEKVKRIKERFDLSDYEEIIAYGDSEGDREMFSIANHHFFKPFRN